MFSHGLESLLRQETNFDIVGQEKDIDLAIEQIKKLQPDVVILDNDNAVPQVTPILHASPGVKVISLSLQNNDLYVYQAKQWVARETEDLLEALGNFPQDTKTLVKKRGNE
jgi:DNA-binding NarL/FixJ family response regulator